MFERDQDQPPSYPSLLTVDKTKTLSNIICCKGYSNLSKVLLVTAFVTRFIDNLRGRIKGQVTTEPILQLTAHEISRAERLWVIEAQKTLLGELAFET